MAEARLTHILIYHALDSPASPVAVDNQADLSVVVGVQNFKDQLQCLARLRKRVLPLEDVLCKTHGGSAKDTDRVVLTFDDGHKSNYSMALPLLLEADMVATFYVVAGFVDKDPEYVTSDQLREMAENNMSIGSHTMSHRWLPLLSPRDIRRELFDSKARLEDLLQKPVLDFALPGGHANRSVFDAIRDSGYRSVATSKSGVYCTGDDNHRLPRLEIRRGLSIDGFRKRFNKRKILQLQLAEAAKTCVRTSLGLSRYMRLRRFAHRCKGIVR